MNNNSEPTKRPAYSLEGWVARDAVRPGQRTTKGYLYLYLQKPYVLTRPGIPEFWTSDGEIMSLPETMFPKLSCHHQPLKIRIELWKE